MTTPEPPETEADPSDPSTSDVHGPRPRIGWRARIGFVAASSLLIVLVASLVIRVPYYVLAPGSSRPTEPLISISGADTYENDGTVDFLTVSERQATPLELLAAWMNPALVVKSDEDLHGKQTPSENRTINLAMMAESKDAATYQALHRMGYEIGVDGKGAVIASVAEGAPASGSLAVGDVVTAIDGTPVMLSSQLVQIVGAHAPGDVLRFTVHHVDDTGDNGSHPDGAASPERVVSVTLGARPDDATKGYLGITSFTLGLSFRFPVEVTIESGAVGGPSAGLAFTLGILDRLTPGSITGGLAIATTGTISLDGTVGPIGGIQQKVRAAQRQGVELMLVPASQLDEALEVGDGLDIQGVATLDEALALLARHGGGDAVLPPPPGRS